MPPKTNHPLETGSRPRSDLVSQESSWGHPLNDLEIHLENDSDSQLDLREGVGDGREVVRMNGRRMKQTCADV